LSRGAFCVDDEVAQLCDMVEEASVSHGPISKGDIRIYRWRAFRRGVGVWVAQNAWLTPWRIIVIMLNIL